MSLTKLFMAMILAVGTLALGAGLVLGPRLGPFVETVRESAEEQLVKLVEEHKLALNESKAALARAKEKAGKLRMAAAEGKAGLVRLDRGISLAEQSVVDIEADLLAIQRRLEAGLPVRLVSGRQLSNEEAAMRVRHAEQRLALAGDRIAAFRQLRERRLERLRKLDAAQERIPMELAQLELSVELLGEKVRFYEEWQQQLGEEEDAEAAVAGILGDAQRTLEEAHAAVDAKLAQVDALVDTPLTDPIAPVAEPSAHGEDVLADIRRITAGLDPFGDRVKPEAQAK